jgi:hypothetical protein
MYGLDSHYLLFSYYLVERTEGYSLLTREMYEFETYYIEKIKVRKSHYKPRRCLGGEV